MPSKKIYKADKVFTGDGWLTEHAVVISDGKIQQIIPGASVSHDDDCETFGGCLLAPAFIDEQIYGASGRLFAVYPEPDSLARLSEHCRSGGAAYCLPTAATNKPEVFYRCIDATKDYWKQGGQGILGLHIEGPWINPAKRGAHIESLIHPPTLQEVRELLDYGDGVIKVITLAPEVCSEEIIELILSTGIILSAGHSNATFTQAMEGFNKGIRLATHLYNAMSPLQHRQPGLVGAVFSHPTVMCSVIPDGHHVDYAAIRIAKRLMGARLFAITDAVTETKEGYYQHYLAGDKYEAAGILSGSALVMNKALQNLVNHVKIEREEALRMCSLYPAQALGLEKRLGKIEIGFEGKIVALNDAMEVVRVIT